MLLDLCLPVCEEPSWGDNQNRSRLPLLLSEPCHEEKRLEGFAEPHVIGEQRPGHARGPARGKPLEADDTDAKQSRCPSN